MQAIAETKQRLVGSTQTYSECHRSLYGVNSHRVQYLVDSHRSGEDT
jgi:hypothetical protein